MSHEKPEEQQLLVVMDEADKDEIIDLTIDDEAPFPVTDDNVELIDLTIDDEAPLPEIVEVHGSYEFEVPMHHEYYDQNVGQYVDVSTSSFDEENADQNFGTDDVLDFAGSRVEILERMGEGCFGAVYRCLLERQCEVAVKILKAGDQYTYSGVQEAEILTEIGQNQAHCLTFFGSFLHKCHMCLVSELLQQSLLQLLPQYGWKLTLDEVRPIVHDLASALAKLAELGIAHSDLKPENIMVINHETHPFRVKVIDFGLAHRISVCTNPEPYIQPRYYRAPEIILHHMPYSVAIDMWSVGCIIAQCVAGRPLYPGRGEYDQMRYIFETQGLPDESMLDRARRTVQFFVWDPTETRPWRLKTPHEFLDNLHEDDRSMASDTVLYEERLPAFDDLCQIVDEPSVERIFATADYMKFLDLLQQMLQINPVKRSTPLQVLGHHFLTMEHFDDLKNLGVYGDHCL